MATTARKPLTALTQNAPVSKRDAAATSKHTSRVAASTAATSGKAKASRVALPTTAASKSTVGMKSAVAPASISSMIAADRARAKANASSSASSSSLPSGARAPGPHGHFHLSASSSSLSGALAAKTYRDPKWSAKQEKRFVNWINQQLVGQAQPNADQAEPIVPDALFARYRGQAVALCQADAMQAIWAKVDSEVDAGRITLKLSSSQLTLDYSLRTSLFALIYSSLTTFWLRLLIESLTGSEVPKPRVREQVEQFVKEWMFGTDGKVPQQDDSEAGLASSTGVDAEGRKREELTRTQADARTTLKKVLHLLLLANACKNARIGGAAATTSRLRAASTAAAASNNGPPLFRPTSTHASTSSLLASFSSTYLNEGDISRHLSFLQYRLSYVEASEDSVDFAVRNLATDLRDGVRLGKLVEVLLKKEQAINAVTSGRKGGVMVSAVDLISQMRIPADSEAKKLHNLQIALGALERSQQQQGKHQPQSITAEDIYSGNQIKTYSFLWSLILRFDVQQLLSTGELQQEITRIRLAHSTFARRMQSSSAFSASASLLLRPQENLYFGPSSQLQSLLTWVQTVVWGQALQALETQMQASSHASDKRKEVTQMRIENFTTSFRSGVAACLIVNYYFPALLPLDEMQQMTQRPDKMAWEAVGKEEEEEEGQTSIANGSPRAAKENDLSGQVTPSDGDGKWVGSFSCSSVFSIPDLKDQPDFIAARQNYQLVARTLQYLGGDVALASISLDSFLASCSASTSAGVPDEKECIAFLAALAARMLVLAEEIHAVKKIQKVARQYIERVSQRRADMAADLALRQAEVAASKKLEALARIEAAQKEAEAKQAAMEAQAKRRAAKEAADAEAARVISEKRAAERAAAQARQLELQRREWEARQREEEEEERVAQEAELALQRQAADALRAEEQRVEREKAEAEWIQQEAAAAELRQVEEAAGAIALQHSSAVAIQCAFRSFQARCHLAFLRAEEAARIARAIRLRSAVAIQCAMRCHIARRVSRELMQAREEQLRVLRAEEAERALQAIRCHSALTIQCAIRGRMARRVKQDLMMAREAKLQQQANAATAVQCAFRSFQARRTLSALRAGHAAELEGQRLAATSIQCAWRSRSARRELFELKTAETARVARIRAENAAAVQIQSAFRCYSARCALFYLRAEEAARVEAIRHANGAATRIQSAYRMHTAKRALSALRAEEAECLARFHQKRHSTLRIQSIWRGYSARKQFHAMRSTTLAAVVVLQKHFRSFAARQLFARLAEDRRIFLAEQQEAQRIFLVQQQEAERIFLAEKQAELEQRSVMVLQCAYRSFVARRTLAGLQQHRADQIAHARDFASTKIQSIVRMYLAKEQLQVLRHNEVMRQAHIRRTGAAEVLQRAFRCSSARHQLSMLRAQHAAFVLAQHRAAIQLQCFGRRIAATRVLMELKKAKVAREHLAALQHRSALVLQCAFRSFLARRTLATLRAEHAAALAFAVRQSAAALTIQCAFRLHLARLAYRSRVQARLAAIEAERERVARNRAEMVRIQAELKALEARAKVLAAERAAEKKRALAATTLQSAFRGRQTRRYLASVQSDLLAVAEASKFRCAAVEKLRTLQLHRSARVVQRTWRAYLTSPVYLAKKLAVLTAAATQIQSLCRGFLARRYAARRASAIITVQRMWRGRADRKSLGKLMKKALAGVALRLRAARASASVDKQIGSRTRSALEVLLSSANLSTVLQATQTLDRTTALLPCCCRDAVFGQNAVPALIEVTKSLNRSKPHLLLLEATMNVLLNLAQEKTTRGSVFGQAGAASLLDALTEAMQAYAGSASILLKLSRFLSIGLEATPELRSTLRESAPILKRVTGVHSLLARKLALETKSATATAMKNGAVSSSSAATKKAVKPIKMATPTFDQFACACHGVIGATASTSAEKLTSLSACVEHVQEVLQGARA